MKSLKEDYKALKKQYKADQLKSDRDAKRKDESIKFFQDEMVRLKKEAAGPQKSKSKRSGDAEQRIAHLEDEVDHWKSQNIVLEDEIAMWKAEADEWKAKAGARTDYQSDDDISIGSMTSNKYAPEDPLQASQHSISSVASKDLFFVSDKVARDTSGDDADETASQRAARSVASLWSTLTTPKNPAKPKVNSAIPAYFGN